MPSDGAPQTRERWRFRLPHWEVAGRMHFVTIRCAGSLPAEAMQQVRKINDALQQIEPNSAEFVALQRKHFLLCERYLDAGYGFCPFGEGSVAKLIVVLLETLHAHDDWIVETAVVMPNHVHLLLQPTEAATPLRVALRGWKWRTAKEANRLLCRTGAFWQPDWFDRWMRNEEEEQKTRDYIRRNPIKAGLVARAEDYPWLR